MAKFSAEEWLKFVSDDVKELNKDELGGGDVKVAADESKLEKDFYSLWRSMGGHLLASEYQFHPERRWRFDFAHEGSKVAIELEGGVWTKGRHVRPQGFINDCEKYNAAAGLGWLVFRLPAEFITFDYLEQIMDVIHDRRIEVGGHHETWFD